MTKPRIVLLNPSCLDVLHHHRDWIATLAIDLVADEVVRKLRPDQVDAALHNADGLILPSTIRSLPLAEHMERHKSIQVLSIAASGYDWLDVEAATRYGIVATNAPVREGIEVAADLAFGLMLAVARQIPHHDQLLRVGQSHRGVGVSLWGKTLGIVGLGNIGKAVARRAIGFDMKVLTATPRPDLDFVRQHGIEILSCEELMRRSDFISLHVRLNAETTHMIGAKQLSQMKPAAFLINAARQELVDESALTDALVNHRLAGTAMDDPPLEKNSPLLKLPNFVCTPHLGNRAIEGMNAVLRCAVENAITVLKGGRPASVVNPEVYRSAIRAMNNEQ